MHTSPFIYLLSCHYMPNAKYSHFLRPLKHALHFPSLETILRAGGNYKVSSSVLRPSSQLKYGTRTEQILTTTAEEANKKQT